MTRAEYDAQGAERTDRGLDESCGTPEFAKWMAKQSHRVRLVATDLDSDGIDDFFLACTHSFSMIKVVP